MEYGSPNGLAYLVLFGFLPLAIALFSVFRPAVATLVVFLSSAMFLPELLRLDLPGLPGIGKEEIASLACLAGCLLRARRRIFAARPFRGVDLFLVLLMIGDLGTVLTNKDVLSYGPTTLPALSFSEARDMMAGDFMRYFLPFFLGRALFQDARDLRRVLVGLAIAGMVYTPFLLFEKVMSPQLHNMVYGYHQSAFVMTLRAGGYRPMVFMAHGLAVALFMMWCVTAAITLWKAKKPVLGLPSVVVWPYLGGWLAALNSMGGLLYALLAGPMVALLKPKIVVRIAIVIAAFVLLYPVTRATNLFPEDALVGAFAAKDAERAESLAFRFRNEHMIAEHTSERAMFGWGRFRRNVVFHPEEGFEMTVSDGHWIVVYSVRGAWGFLCFFGLFLFPIFALRKRFPKIWRHDERTMIAGLAIIAAFTALDFIPNGLFNTIDLFLVGVLYGTAKGLAASGNDDDDDEVPVTAPDGRAPIPPQAVPQPFRPSEQGAAGTGRG